MLRGHVLMTLGLALAAPSLLSAGEPSRPATAAPRLQPLHGFELAGPVHHANLALYFLRGKDRIQEGRFLTLDEALEHKHLVVHETEEVNQLRLDNQSKDRDLFLHRGEIVSGGKQDRMLGTDLVVPAGARGVPIPSFCVERGRWSPRAGLGEDFFGTQSNYVRRVAPDGAAEIGNVPSAVARFGRQQARVWGKVRGRQEALAGNVPEFALPRSSPSSLDLTLEVPQLKAAVAEYTAKLAKAPEGRGNVLGVAVAINGEVDSADVYGSADLFRRLWPKLLKAAVVDALARLEKGKACDPPAAEAVQAWLQRPRTGKAVKRTAAERIGEHIWAVHVETEEDVVLDTFDERAGALIHRACLRKLPSPPPAPAPPTPDLFEE